MQQGCRFIYDEDQLVSTGTTNQSWTTQDGAVYIPSISTRGIFQANLSGSSGVTLSLRKNGSTTTTGHIVSKVGWASQATQDAAVDCLDTDNNQRVQLNVGGGTLNNWILRVRGFELNL